jgi:hypothetical protein
LELFNGEVCPYPLGVEIGGGKPWWNINKNNVFE